MSRVNYTPNSRQAADSIGLPNSRTSVVQELENRLANLGVSVTVKPPKISLRGGPAEPEPRPPDSKLIETAAIVVGLIAVAAFVVR